MHNCFRYLGHLGVMGLLSLTASTCVAANTNPNAVEGVLEKSVERAAAVGQSTEAWQGERAALLEELQDLELKDAWTAFQLEKTERWLAREQENVATLKANLAQAEDTRRSMEPFLEVLYADLEAHVKGDLPFSMEERERRLAGIRDILDNPESSLSQKFGRLLDALQIESNYGYLVEVDEEIAEIDGEQSQVKILRLGRLAMYRLGNAETTLERFNPSDKTWQPLDAQYIPEIRKAMEIARKKRVGSVVNLPLVNAQTAGEGK